MQKEKPNKMVEKIEKGKVINLNKFKKKTKPKKTKKK